MSGGSSYSNDSGHLWAFAQRLFSEESIPNPCSDIYDSAREVSYWSRQLDELTEDNNNLVADNGYCENLIPGLFLCRIYTESDAMGDTIDESIDRMKKALKQSNLNGPGWTTSWENFSKCIVDSWSEIGLL